MALTNTVSSYGAVARGLHWATVLGIVVLVPLGLIATDLAHQLRDAASPDPAMLARAGQLFSWHKTLGLAVFLLAAIRILWAISQPRPGLLNAERRFEAGAAETVHWLLYGSLVAMPLTGWAHHAATEGYAPILWPFGQGLPFVPKDMALAEVLGIMHRVSGWVMGAAIALHVVGALKHHLIDRDATLRRMVTGQGPAVTVVARRHVAPAFLALAIWGGAVGLAAGPNLMAAEGMAQAAAPKLAAAAGEWQVSEGALRLTVQQFGKPVMGQFADWTADIRFTDDPAQAQNGTVTVQVAIASLTLGSVTTQAMGPDFFDAATHPVAMFRADILRDDAPGGYVARGTLALKGVEVPLDLPFTLALDDDQARMTGQAVLDRRVFGIGAAMTDAGTLDFAVVLDVTLTATRN